MPHDDFLRFRQIHLDFHTSEHIAGIGGEFDADAWARMLVDARVDSITCFARGHHGWIYYETEKNPERRHPHLACNLLSEQIDAAHAHDIRVPIYTTVQWDHYTAERHPEWRQMDATGSGTGTPPFEAGFYRGLCLNSPYVDFLQAHTQDILETLPVDGFFFDIVQPQNCVCRYCKGEMLEQGLDPADPVQRQQFGLQVTNRFMEEMTAFVRGFNDDCTIFYNGGHIGPRHRPVKDAFSHFELESLPSGGWGYMHFPLAMRYARTLGKDCLGMTGKFHTSWGDFQSFKNEAALQFECFQMLALNAKCSIGDQLHPTGRLDPESYRLVGSVYAAVEEKEPWCRGVEPVVDIGLFTPEEFTTTRLTAETMGAVRMLQEGALQFDILDSQSDLSAYKLLVMPDNYPVTPELAQKVQAYLAGGGTLIASFESGLDPAKERFALDQFGVKKAGEGPVDSRGNHVRGRHYPKGDYVDYLRPGEAIGRGMRAADHVMYMRGMEIRASNEPEGDGPEVLAWSVPSYFDRTWRHFVSHRQTPPAGETGGPAIVRNGNVIYFAHPIFRQYSRNAPRWCKTLFLNALSMLLPDPVARHDGPSTLLLTVNEQADERRWIVHLLHYIPERRGQDFDVLEDVIPLHDLRVSVRVPESVEAVQAVPEGKELTFTATDGEVTFTLPRLDGHQMVEIRF